LSFAFSFYHLIATTVSSVTIYRLRVIGNTTIYPSLSLPRYARRIY